MTRHIVRSDGHDRGAFVAGTFQNDAVTPKYSHRLIIEGTQNGGIGYGIGSVPPGLEARQTHGGPLVPGPWAFTFGLSAVIDNHGGSRRMIDEQRAAGKVIDAVAGDTIVMDGREYLLVVDARRYPSLVELTESLDAEAELAHVASLHLFRSYHGSAR